jgi:DHA1 family tetracycline resistance protein-like MFS transporter
VARSPRAALPVLFSVVVLDLIGFGILMPILPFLADHYGASGTLLGLLFSVYAAAQFLCAPLWGRLSDRIGRRPVMLGTIAGTAVALAWVAVAPSLLWLFVARALGGAFAANVSVATAYVADVTEESERTRWMGMIGASFAVGFTLGPALGALLAPLGIAAPLYAAAGLGVLNLVWALLRLQEPERHAASAAPAPGDRRTLLRDPIVRRLCLANLAFAAAVTQLETVFAYLVKDRFGFDAVRFGILLVAMAVVMGGIQGGGMKALSARYRERSLVIVGSLLLAVAFATLPAAPTVAILLAPLVLAAVGRAILQPSLMSLASMAGAASQRGAVMGTFQSAASLARVFGPAAAGVLYDSSSDAPFLLAAGLAVLVGVLARGLPDRESHPGGPVAATG